MGRSDAGVLAAVCAAWMGVAVEIPSAIASALLRKMASLLIQHLILLNVDLWPEKAAGRDGMAGILSCRAAFSVIAVRA